MQHWVKRDEKKLGSRMAWSASRWALRMCKIFWPIWIRRWLPSRRSIHTLCDPVEILFAARSQLQHYAFRKIVRMKLFHGITDALKQISLSLDQEQPLRGCFYLIFPAIDGFNLRHNVDAGSHAPFDHRSVNLPVFFLRSCFI